MKNTCKKCGSIKLVKSGKIRGKQRYKCKECGCNFVIGDLREKVKPEGKALAMLLYGRGTESQHKLKASYGFISKLFNVSRTTVLKWIRSTSSRLPEPEMDDTIKEIQVDEMSHFINKKNKKYGFGEPWIVLETKPWDGLLAIVLVKPLKSSTKK